MSLASDRQDFAESIQRTQREWRELPLIDRSAMQRIAQPSLSAGFAGLAMTGAPDVSTFVAVMRAFGSTKAELVELEPLYKQWRAGAWNEPGVLSLSE